MIGAHWDTVPNSGGMDDNGSGVTAVLEVYRDHMNPFSLLTYYYFLSGSTSNDRRWLPPQAHCNICGLRFRRSGMLRKYLFRPRFSHSASSASARRKNERRVHLGYDHELQRNTVLAKSIYRMAESIASILG